MRLLPVLERGGVGEDVVGVALGIRGLRLGGDAAGAAGRLLLGGWLGNSVHYDGNTDMWNFVISNFGSFLVAPAVLILLLFGSNSLAKAIVGEG